ncbi:uncharacterized protein LOC142697962 [Rhinoderma darwinii]|uniref:uncharacterized protein LOC142662437 n=1 Tax=Rhinoderma darwinii TaxID=43563 RepID=UPI003F674FE5
MADELLQQVAQRVSVKGTTWLEDLLRQKDGEAVATAHGPAAGETRGLTWKIRARSCVFVVSSVWSDETVSRHRPRLSSLYSRVLVLLPLGDGEAFSGTAGAIITMAEVDVLGGGDRPRNLLSDNLPLLPRVVPGLRLGSATKRGAVLGSDAANGEDAASGVVGTPTLGESSCVDVWLSKSLMSGNYLESLLKAMVASLDKSEGAPVLSVPPGEVKPSSVRQANLACLTFRDSLFYGMAPLGTHLPAETKEKM